MCNVEKYTWIQDCTKLVKVDCKWLIQMAYHAGLCEWFAQRDGDHVPSPVQRIVKMGSETLPRKNLKKQHSGLHFTGQHAHQAAFRLAKVR